MTVLPLYTALRAGCRGSGLLCTWPDACEAGIEAYQNPPITERLATDAASASCRARDALTAFREAVGVFLPRAVWRQALEWRRADEASIRALMTREALSPPMRAQPTHLLRAATADWAGYQTGPLTPAEIDALGGWLHDTSWWVLYDNGHAYWLAYANAMSPSGVISRLRDAIGLPVLDWLDGRADEPLTVEVGGYTHRVHGLDEAARVLLGEWPHIADVRAADDVIVRTQDGIDRTAEAWRRYGRLAAERIVIEEDADGELIPSDATIDGWAAETEAHDVAWVAFCRHIDERLEAAASGHEDWVRCGRDPVIYYGAPPR